MTSHFLQTTLSPIVTRGRNSLILRLSQTTTTTSSLSYVIDLYLERTVGEMPVIHAVAAHRHCHHLCQQPSHVPALLANDFLYTYNKQETSQRSITLDTTDVLNITDNINPKSKQSAASSSWTNSRSKNFLSGGGKSIFHFNFLGTSSLSNVQDQTRRSYSKTKDKGAKKKTTVVINEEEMNEAINVESLKIQLDGQLTHMKDEYASQLSIRGTAGTLELLEVEFEGEKYPLQELAQIGRKNPQLIVLNLASLPDACQPVIKAIQESGMNLNPQQEGTTIFIPLPKVTREHREHLAKNAKVIFTKYKASLQGVQNRFVKNCKSHKDVSEDLVFSVSQQIMKMTDNYIADAEKLMQDKQKELLDITL